MNHNILNSDAAFTIGVAFVFFVIFDSEIEISTWPSMQEFIYIITTLFFDPKPEDKGSYYWIKMLLLILLLVFPEKADVTLLKQHKDENNHQKETMTSSNNDFIKKDTSGRGLSDKEFQLSAKNLVIGNQITRQQQVQIMKKSQSDAKTDFLGTTPITSPALSAKVKNISAKKISTIMKGEFLPIQQNQIPSKKFPPLVPEMKLQLDSEAESSNHTKDEFQTTLTQESLIVPESKSYAFVKESQTASPKKPKSVKKCQIIRPLKKSQMLQVKKFTDTSVLKSDIFPIQEFPIVSTEKLQILPSSELQTAHEEIPQRKPARNSQSRQDLLTFAKELQFSARELQLTYSKEDEDDTHPKIVPTVPKKKSQVIQMNKPQTTVIQQSQLPSSRKLETTLSKIVPIIPVKNEKRIEEFPADSMTDPMIGSAKEHRIIDLKDSKGSTMRKSKIGPDKEIQIASVKEPEAIFSKELEDYRVKKFKELQHLPVGKFQTISTDRPGITFASKIQLAPLKISTTVSTKESQHISNKETEEPQLVPKHELKTVPVEESHFLPAGESQIPAVSIRGIPHDKESQSVPASEIEPLVRESSDNELQASPLKESDTVTETETQISRTNKLINIPEQQFLPISDASINFEKKENAEVEISQDVFDEKKSDNIITWVAVGKTVVISQYEQTEKVN
ncbi:unnamed protein product [Onchocerca flexuosa]|uniref:TPR_REGION domain-containing protein n=1 Tax=Onchocerca flexuosa TaxID=387005 RepID=A0A183H9R8_9BILA|nr:unnamed protein product [Onchocerca flexuosa]